MKFHHIGYLTNNFKKSIKEFKEISYTRKGKVITDNILQVKIQFIYNSNQFIDSIENLKDETVYTVNQKDIFWLDTKLSMWKSVLNLT